jgi:hypothetical protein
MGGASAFSHSRFSSYNQKPLIFLLEPVVYFIENPRSTSKAVGQLLNGIGESGRF